mmetsp:Transcript_45127/g.89437  ORF Transcript_45127/g.89437 Transcript_45127/m.89437 type:complete len:208 (+) Transcript_45127:226-849(+)
MNASSAASTSAAQAPLSPAQPSTSCRRSAAPLLEPQTSNTKSPSSDFPISSASRAAAQLRQRASHKALEEARGPQAASSALRNAKRSLNQLPVSSFGDRVADQERPNMSGAQRTKAGAIRHKRLRGLPMSAMPGAGSKQVSNRAARRRPFLRSSRAPNLVVASTFAASVASGDGSCCAGSPRTSWARRSITPFLSERMRSPWLASAG